MFAKIDAETPASRKSSFSIGAWLTEFISGFSPRTLAWSATAAAVAIVVQAAALTTVIVKDHGNAQGIELASALSTDGSLAMIRFAPQVTSSDITTFLNAHKLTIVDGPKPGAVYRVRISNTAASKDDMTKVIKQLQVDTKVVSFIAAID